MSSYQGEGFNPMSNIRMSQMSSSQSCYGMPINPSSFGNMGRMYQPQPQFPNQPKFDANSAYSNAFTTSQMSFLPTQASSQFSLNTNKFKFSEDVSHVIDDCYSEKMPQSLEKCVQYAAQKFNPLLEAHAQEIENLKNDFNFLNDFKASLKSISETDIQASELKEILNQVIGINQTTQQINLNMNNTMNQQMNIHRQESTLKNNLALLTQKLEFIEDIFKEDKKDQKDFADKTNEYQQDLSKGMMEIRKKFEALKSQQNACPEVPSFESKTKDFVNNVNGTLSNFSQEMLRNQSQMGINMPQNSMNNSTQQMNPSFQGFGGNNFQNRTQNSGFNFLSLNERASQNAKNTQKPKNNIFGNFGF